MNFKKIIKILVVFAIIGLSFSPFLTLNHNMGNGQNGKMANCLLMVTDSTSCQMNIGEHLLVWQETFLASINSHFILILNFLSIVLLVSFIKYLGTDPPLRLLKKIHKENRRLSIFNYLLAAFSKGLVHPEIYA